MRRKYKRVAVYCIAEIISENPLGFDYFKIGVTSELRSRVKALQTANPRKLAVIIADWYRSEKDARAVERRAHDYLAPYSVSGEWFKSYEIGGGCPFEALAIAGAITSYVPASEAFYDHEAPDWEPMLLPEAHYYPGKDKRPGGRLFQ